MSLQFFGSVFLIAVMAVIIYLMVMEKQDDE